MCFIGKNLNMEKRRLIKGGTERDSKIQTRSDLLLNDFDVRADGNILLSAIENLASQ